jgi:hypothetical protein
MVETADGRRHGIECKFPKNKSFGELSRSLSQLLAYAVIVETNQMQIDQLWLFTVEYNPVLNQVINRYELPIRVVVFSRTQRAELIHG